MTKPIRTGTKVIATDGKHKGEVGVVLHSDKSITSVQFAAISDPVWTVSLEVTA